MKRGIDELMDEDLVAPTPLESREVSYFICVRRAMEEMWRSERGKGRTEVKCETKIWGKSSSKLYL